MMTNFDEVSEYTIKLNTTSVSAVELSRLIRDCCFPGRFTLSELLHISRSMLKGEAWRPAFTVLCCDPRKSELAEITTIVYERHRTEMEIEYEQRQVYWKMLEAGAAGDAEAAMAVCKLIVTHKYMPSVCAGG